MLMSTLENLLNRGLPRSPRARQLCAELSGRKVAVEVRGMMRVVVASVGDSLTVSRAAAPVVIRASAQQAQGSAGPHSAAPADAQMGGGSQASGDSLAIVDAEISGAPF